MAAKAHKRRDMLQNIAIVLLSVLAVVLFTQTQLYFLGVGSGYFSRLSDAAETGAAPAAHSSALTAPVRVAVTNDYGRYGNVCLTTSDDSFAPLRGLLAGALGSAKAFQPCTSREFLSALSHTSVYYDFLSPLPLAYLAGLAGSAEGDEGRLGRRLVICVEGEGVDLYLWDGSGSYARCGTAVTAADLRATVSRFELGNASFALDQLDADPNFASIEPCSLFPAQLPELAALSASTLPNSADRVLRGLQFNVHTKSRYLESSGTEVILEGERELRLRPDGTVLYKSGGDVAVTLSAAGEQITVQEAASGSAALLSTLLGAAGDASLYLQSVRQSGGITSLQFDYQIGGVPIRFSNGSHAAQVTLSGSAVTSLTLRLRQYTATDTASLLLPLRQALAIAAGNAGAELSIGYADQGGDAVHAAWLLD